MLAEAGNPELLREAIVIAAGWRGRHFTGTELWQDTAARFGELLDAVKRDLIMPDLA